MQGASADLQHEVGRGTIANILKAVGLEPAPQRHQGMTWKVFLKTHWEVLADTDFFTGNCGSRKDSFVNYRHPALITRIRVFG
jgi:hypothetical protein